MYAEKSGQAVMLTQAPEFGRCKESNTTESILITADSIDSKVQLQRKCSTSTEILVPLLQELYYSPVGEGKTEYVGQRTQQAS